MDSEVEGVDPCVERKDPGLEGGGFTGIRGGGSWAGGGRIQGNKRGYIQGRKGQIHRRQRLKAARGRQIKTYETYAVLLTETVPVGGKQYKGPQRSSQ